MVFIGTNKWIVLKLEKNTSHFGFIFHYNILFIFLIQKSVRSPFELDLKEILDFFTNSK